MDSQNLSVAQQLQQHAQSLHQPEATKAFSHLVKDYFSMAQGISDTFENFWLTLVGGLIVALFTGLGWFVYSSSTDLASIKQEQVDMRGEISGMHQDVRDIKDALFGRSGPAPATGH